MFKEFIKLFGNMIIMIGIVMASFLLLINLYHYRDISHTYNVDFEQVKSINTTYDNISKSEKMLNMSLSGLDVSTANTAKFVKGNINKCITTFKDASIYKQSGIVNFSYYDVNVNNSYLYTSINRDCYAMFNNNVSSALKSFDNLESTYEEFFNQYEQIFSSVLLSSNYLQRKTLDTNFYSFTSDMGRFTVFDDLKNDFDLTVKNYEVVSSLILDMATWYSNSFGGDLDE